MGPTVRWNSAQHEVFEWWKEVSLQQYAAIGILFCENKFMLGRRGRRDGEKRVGWPVAFKLLKWPPCSWHMAASWLSGQIAPCTVQLWLQFVPVLSCCECGLYLYFVLRRPYTADKTLKSSYYFCCTCTVLLWTQSVLTCCECRLSWRRVPVLLDTLSPLIPILSYGSSCYCLADLSKAHFMGISSLTLVIDIRIASRWKPCIMW